MDIDVGMFLAFVFLAIIVGAIVCARGAIVESVLERRNLLSRSVCNSII